MNPESAKTMARERERLRELITAQQSHTPLPELIGRVNRHLRGWAHYYSLGYPRQAFRDLNHVRFDEGEGSGGLPCFPLYSTGCDFPAGDKKLKERASAGRMYAQLLFV